MEWRQLWLYPFKKIFNPLKCLPPNSEAQKGISFWVKGIKERRQNFELSLRQEPPPFVVVVVLFLVQILSFSFLWPLFLQVSPLSVTQGQQRLFLNSPDKPEEGAWKGLFGGALARLMVVLSMENRTLSQVLFSFPSLTLPLSTHHFHICLSGLKLRSVDRREAQSHVFVLFFGFVLFLKCNSDRYLGALSLPYFALPGHSLWGRESGGASLCCFPRVTKPSFLS